MDVKYHNVSQTAARFVYFENLSNNRGQCLQSGAESVHSDLFSIISYLKLDPITCSSGLHTNAALSPKEVPTDPRQTNVTEEK